MSRVQVFGFRVSSNRIAATKWRNNGFGFPNPDLLFRDPDYGSWDPGFGYQDRGDKMAEEGLGDFRDQPRVVPHDLADRVGHLPDATSSSIHFVGRDPVMRTPTGTRPRREHTLQDVIPPYVHSSGHDWFVSTP